MRERKVAIDDCGLDNSVETACQSSQFRLRCVLETPALTISGLSMSCAWVYPLLYQGSIPSNLNETPG